jgi:hypothetical protein
MCKLCTNCRRWKKLPDDSLQSGRDYFRWLPGKIAARHAIPHLGDTTLAGTDCGVSIVAPLRTFARLILWKNSSCKQTHLCYTLNSYSHGLYRANEQSAKRKTCAERKRSIHAETSESGDRRWDMSARGDAVAEGESRTVHAVHTVHHPSPAKSDQIKPNQTKKRWGRGVSEAPDPRSQTRDPNSPIRPNPAESD